MNFLGIDVGSTNIKCQLTTNDNQLLFQASKSYQMIEKDGQSYVDIMTIENELETMLKDASQKGKIDAISISSFGESFVLLDKNDHILSLPMIYTDHRGSVEAESITQVIDLKTVYQITGTVPQSIYSLYKLLWIKNNHPHIFNQSDKFMQIADYLNYKLTGQHATDFSLAARSGLFDIENKQFSSLMIEKLSLQNVTFPKPLKTGSVIGQINESFVNKYDVNPICKVVVGGHDQVMAAIGSGVIQNNMCVDGMGTVECMTTTFEHRIDDLEMGLKGYAIVPFLNGYCTYLFNYTGGSLVHWSKKELFQNQFNEFEMEERVRLENKEEPTGILSLPYFGGAATPHQNIHATGSIINLNMKTKASTIYKSLLEGLSYEMKYNLDVVKPFGIEPQKIIVSGGGSLSKLWLQIKANILQQNIYPLVNKESGITGAIILCYQALYPQETLTSITNRFVTYKNPIKPDLSLVEQYQKQYVKYQKVYEAVLQFSNDE